MRLSSADQDNILESVRVTLRPLPSPPTPPLEEEEEKKEDSTKINLNTLSINATDIEKKKWHVALGQKPQRQKFHSAWVLLIENCKLRVFSAVWLSIVKHK